MRLTNQLTKELTPRSRDLLSIQYLLSHSRNYPPFMDTTNILLCPQRPSYLSVKTFKRIWQFWLEIILDKAFLNISVKDVQKSAVSVVVTCFWLLTLTHGPHIHCERRNRSPDRLFALKKAMISLS
jgi:hypothetical protein